MKGAGNSVKPNRPAPKGKTMLDYKDYEEGKYPEPEDRVSKDDFPPAEDLFVYGEDVPIPESFEELRCKYNLDDRNPLVLEDLEGYKVPPLGLTTVSKNGGGFQAKRKGGWVYPPDTFRKNKYGINMELGATHDAITIARERKAKEAQTEAIITFLKDKLGDEMDFEDANTFKSAKAVEGLMLWSLQMIDDKQAAREAVRVMEWYVKQQQHKDDIIDRHKEKEMTFSEALEFVKQVKEKGILDNPVDITVVEGEIEDIEELDEK